VSTRADPHAGQPVLRGGVPLAEARAAVVLAHGRGASAADILLLAGELRVPHVAYLAPQAAGNEWYPYRFVAPLAQNEPWLSSALGVLSTGIGEAEAAGLPLERIGLLGFSQGACLILEYAARHARRYAGVFGLTGGLIGPDGTPREYSGSLAGTPVFVGSSDPDPHIPVERAVEAADVLRRLGGEVTLRLYPNLGHTVNEDELQAIRAVLAPLVADAK
jgi:predicted esterase